MFDALAAPGVDHMDMAVATLDDGGVGVLQDGRVFERYPVVPMDAVGTTQDGEWRTGTLLLGGFDGPVVTYHGKGAVLQGDSIDAAVVVGRVDELQLAPRLAVVTTVGHADMTATGTAESFKAAVWQLYDGGLDGQHAAVGLDEVSTPPGLAKVVA